MSIVIAVIEKNEKLYMASDKRGERKGVVKDEYQKIYQLDKELYFGMTGILEAGLEILDFIRKNDLSDRYNLIKKVDAFFDFYFRRSRPNKLAVMLAGKDNDGNFFIWQKNIGGEVRLTKSSGIIDFAISSNDKVAIFGNYFRSKVAFAPNVRDAIIKTIEYASEMDPSISKEYELYEILR